MAPRSSFSLASIFVLTAVVAILLAPVRAIVLEPKRLEDWRVTACVVLGGLTGMLIGGVVGANQTRWRSGVLLGILIGYLSGVCGAVLMASPWSLPAVAVGSVVLILLAVVVRRSADGPH